MGIPQNALVVFPPIMGQALVVKAPGAAETSATSPAGKGESNSFHGVMAGSSAVEWSPLGCKYQSLGQNP